MKHQHARQRLDERLSPLKPEDRFHPPPKGWIRAIRDTIGMTGAQLASRLGVRPQELLPEQFDLARIRLEEILCENSFWRS